MTAEFCPKCNCPIISDEKLRNGIRVVEGRPGCYFCNPDIARDEADCQSPTGHFTFSERKEIQCLT